MTYPAPKTSAMTNELRAKALRASSPRLVQLARSLMSAVNAGKDPAAPARAANHMLNVALEEAGQAATDDAAARLALSSVALAMDDDTVGQIAEAYLRHPGPHDRLPVRSEVSGGVEHHDAESFLTFGFEHGFIDSNVLRHRFDPSEVLQRQDWEPNFDQGYTCYPGTDAEWAATLAGMVEACRVATDQRSGGHTPDHEAQDLDPHGSVLVLPAGDDDRERLRAFLTDVYANSVLDYLRNVQNSHALLNFLENEDLGPIFEDLQGEVDDARARLGGLDLTRHPTPQALRDLSALIGAAQFDDAAELGRLMWGLLAERYDYLNEVPDEAWPGLYEELSERAASRGE